MFKALLYMLLFIQFCVRMACVSRHSDSDIYLASFPTKCPDWSSGDIIDGISETKGSCTRIISPLYVNLEHLGCYGSHSIPFERNIYFTVLNRNSYTYIG